jgi:hypothetical protein
LDFNSNNFSNFPISLTSGPINGLSVDSLSLNFFKSQFLYIEPKNAAPIELPASPGHGGTNICFLKSLVSFPISTEL